MQDDRRQTFRCAVVDADVAMLIVGRRRLAVGMIDESREGFAVIARQAPGIEPGATAWLERAAACCQVRVIDVQRQEDEFRVGLARLEEAPFAPPGRRRVEFGGWTLLIVAIAVGFAVWRAVADTPRPARSVSASQSRPEAIDAGMLAAQVAGQATTTGGSTPRLPEAQVFDLPVQAARLGLTDDQRTRIEGILARTAAAAPDLRRLANDRGHARLTPRSQAQLKAALAAVLAVLDERQKQAWRETIAAE
jgi:hypothetical protein